MINIGNDRAQLARMSKLAKETLDADTNLLERRSALRIAGQVKSDEILHAGNRLKRLLNAA